MTETIFSSSIEWTGNRGFGTRTYTSYDRSWRVVTPGKPTIECSNDPALGGDPVLHNPEDLFLSALASCHMLWFLHLASVRKLVVHAYTDAPVGIGETGPGGAGRYLRATLRPTIVLGPSCSFELADSIHPEIHNVCFIARSVNFPVGYEAQYRRIAEAVGNEAVQA